jgi:lambda family phage tail tape measure protein
MNGAVADQMRFNDMLRQTSNLLETNVTSALADVFDGTKTFGAAMQDTGKLVARALEEMIIKMYILRPLMDSMSGVGGGLFGFLGLGSSTAGTVAGNTPVGWWANGGAFAGGRVTAFADGGIVDGPTLFRMASGAGLMGESGPEAIVPLRRNSRGQLGVDAQGVQRRDEPRVVHIHVTGATGNAEVRSMVATGVGAALKQYDAALPGRIAAVNTRYG